MKQPSCAQAPQAEALEDGRLPDVTRAAFEQHAARCTDCTRQLRVLARLRESAQWLPESTLTPLERRRQRQALLRRASALSHRHPVQPRRPVFAGKMLARDVFGGKRLAGKMLKALVLAGALFAAVGIGFRLRASLSASGAPTTLIAQTYRLEASPGASWQTLEQGAALRLKLENGSFTLDVDKLTDAQRFVLELPDGEL